MNSYNTGNMAAAKMCNITKKKEETAEWTGLFQSDLKTEQQSLVFVKRMMAVAVSSITYLRGIFPEEAYRSRYVEDLCIKVLREDCSTPGARKIVKWLMGCFDALERRYLQIVFIGVHTNPEDPNCFIESYQFKFKYTERGPQMDIFRNKNVEMQVTLEDTKKASVLLIRKLFLLMQNLAPLPSDVKLSMKLYYYDDITPAEYEPPGFREGVCDSLWFEGMAVHFRVGTAQTAFHTLKIGVAAEQGRLERLQGQFDQRGSQCATGDSEGVLSRMGETAKPDVDINGSETLPSEDESAQFKKPRKPVVKKKGTGKIPDKKKRRY